MFLCSQVQFELLGWRQIVFGELDDTRDFKKDVTDLLSVGHIWLPEIVAYRYSLLSSLSPGQRGSPKICLFT